MKPNQKKNILYFFFSSLLLINTIATQTVASKLEFQEALGFGIPFFDNTKIYMPWDWLIWSAKFKGSGAEWIFKRYGLMVVLGGVCVLTLLLALYKAIFIKKLEDSHGTAHFATMEEIENTKEIDPPGLLSGKGVILGTLEHTELLNGKKIHKFLRDDTKTHVLVCAPTRSGKGVGIIIPTLLTWKDSVVCTDIKGENWQLTAKWRKEHMNNLIFKFEPTSEFSSKYNPFDEVRIRTKDEVKDIQNIVNILIDPSGKGREGNQAHWLNNAAALLTGVILHLKYKKDHANMYDVLAFLYSGRTPKVEVQDIEDTLDNSIYEDNKAEDFTNPSPEMVKRIENEDFSGFYAQDEDDVANENEEYSELDEIEAKRNQQPETNSNLTGLQARMEMLIMSADLNESDEFIHDPTGKLFAGIYGKEFTGSTPKTHPHVKMYFQSMVDKPAEEFGSILSTLDTVLNTYRDPYIAENTKSCDFTMHDLMNNEKPVSLYLVFPPSDIDRVKPIFRVIIEMLYRRNTETMKFKNGVKIDSLHKMLMLLDEFPALGKLETLESAMAYIAGYGIKAMIITQDINQIEKLYSQSNSIISNCQVQVYHTPTDNKTPEFISRKIGNATIEVKSKTKDYTFFGGFGKSYTLSNIGRPLMTPDEVNQMDKNKELIFVTGVAPILANKIRFYEIPFFSSRTKLGEPNETDKIIHEDFLLESENEQNKQSIIQNETSFVKVDDTQDVIADNNEVKEDPYTQNHSDFIQTNVFDDLYKE